MTNTISKRKVMEKKMQFSSYLAIQAKNSKVLSIGRQLVLNDRLAKENTVSRNALDLGRVAVLRLHVVKYEGEIGADTPETNAMTSGHDHIFAD